MNLIGRRDKWINIMYWIKGKAVFVIAENTNQKILLIKQTKYQTQIKSYEIQAGSVEEVNIKMML